MVEPQGRRKSATESLEKRLEPSAETALQEFLSVLRADLLCKANDFSSGDFITEDDVSQAYKQLCFPSKDSLQFADAQTVISRALGENQVIEWVSYVMAIVFFLFGLALLGFGVACGDVATRVGAFFGGSVVEVLILIPFRFAINSRRHNIALRMLGLILDRVDDPRKVAPLLKDTFLAVVLGRAQFRAGN